MRERRQAAKHLDSLSIRDLVSFMAGPESRDFERGRWADWAAFDAEYAAVREEYLAADFIRPGRLPFAELRYRAIH
jgi:hypothetical protein